MANGNKQLNVNVGVHFEAEGADLNKYLQELKDTISTMQKNTNGSNAFSGTEKKIQKVSDLFSKLQNFKLNSGNTVQFANGVNKLSESLADLKKSFEDENATLEGRAAKYTKNITSANEYIAKHEEEVEVLKKKREAGQKLTDAETKQVAQYNSRLALISRMNNLLKANNLSEEDRLKVQEAINQVLGVEEKVLLGVAAANKENAENEQLTLKQNTLNAIKRKVEYYTSLAFSVRLIRQQLRQAIDTFKEVDKSITSISMVSGISRDTLWGNIGQYNDLAQELGTTTDKVLQASQLYYQQGRNTAEVVDLTRESLQLAAIAGIDTAEATNYLTAAVNGYKMEAAEAGEVTDVWAQLAAKNAVSVKELSVAISKVASIAQSAGMDIQSTSAFLTQMIATTREAPENLGTALKTIIARFQELKTGVEDLEDGVDANKVEKALRTVGIELRDASGQFRNFDDVILELSSKWDSLDRNTQRYIATIAAGSRQQSRFIALVSDYDGLVEIMGQAADAQGAADEQFEVYSTGMEAAINRLKAAWQGFYLSWEKGHNIITAVLKVITQLLNSAAKLGVKGTTIFVGLGLALTKFSIGLIKANTSFKQYISQTLIGNVVSGIHAKITKQDAQATKELSAAQKQQNNALARAITQGLVEAGIISKDQAAKTADAIATHLAADANKKLAESQAMVNATSIVGIIIAIVGALVTLVPLLDSTSGRINKLNDSIEAHKEKVSEATQAVKSADEYTKALEDMVASGQDLTDIRHQLEDTFGEVIKGVNWETDEWYELRDAIAAYKEEQEKIQTSEFYAAAIDERAKQAEEAKTSWREYLKDNWTLGVDKRALEREWRLANQEAYDNVMSQPLELNGATRKGIASQILGDNASDEDIKNMANAIKMLGESVYEYDETTKTFSFKGSTEGLQEILQIGDLSDKDIDELQAYFNNAGTTEGQAYVQGFIDAFNEEQKRVKDQLLLIFGNIFGDDLYRGLNDLNSKLGQAYVQTLYSLNDNPEAQEAYKQSVQKLFETVDPEDITGDQLRALALSKDKIEELYRTQIQFAQDGKVELTQWGEVLADSLDKGTQAFIKGEAAIEHYGSAVKSLQDLTKGSSWQDYSDAIWALSADWEELEYESRQAYLTELWGNTVVDESNQYKQKSSDLLTELCEKYDIKSQAARDAAIKELEAEKDLVDGKITLIQAAITDAQVQVATDAEKLNSAKVSGVGIAKAARGAYAGANKALAGHSEKFKEFIDKNLNPIIATGGIRAGISLGVVENDALTEVEADAIKDIMSIENYSGFDLDTLNGYLSTMQAYSDQLAADILSLENYHKEVEAARSGGGGSSKESTKETEDLTKAMEKAAQTAEKLAKAMQDAAKAEIAAAKTRLEEIKASIEESIKLREKALDASRRHNKIYFEEVKKGLENELQELKDNLDKQNNALQLQAKAVAAVYDEKIKAVQDQIDALDEEAEAEDRLRKLQEARDAYERSRNQRTRLVLTQGAGWIFKTDTEALNEARDGLKTAERDYQKNILQDQIDKLQEEKDAWAEVAENIGKSAKELEEYANALQEVRDSWENLDLEGFKTKVSANNQNVDEVAYQSDASIKDADGNALTLAGKIEEVTENISKIGWDLQDYLDDEYRQNVKKDIDDIFNKYNSPQEVVNGYNNYFGPRFDRFFEYQKEQVQAIDGLQKQIKDEDTKTGIEYEIEAWNKLNDRVGKTEEELAIANKYAGKTVEQLSQNGEIYKAISSKINDKILTDVDTGEEGWYLKVLTAAEKGEIGIIELNSYLKTFKDQIEDRKAEEDSIDTDLLSGKSSSSGTPSASSSAPAPSGGSSVILYNGSDGNNNSNNGNYDYSTNAANYIPVTDTGGGYADTPTGPKLQLPSTLNGSNGDVVSGTQNNSTVYDYSIHIGDATITDGDFNRALRGGIQKNVLGNKSSYGTR